MSEILNYIKEIITILGLVLGIIFGYPILWRKLREDHIKRLQNETQEANKETKFACHKLIEKYLNRTYSDEPLTKDLMQKAFNDIQELNEIALNSSKEVATFAILLKSTLQSVMRFYHSEKRQTTILTSNFFRLYISVLNEVLFFSEKIVSIPWSPSTKQIRYLNKKIRKYALKHKYKRFKYFEQGFENTPCSPLYLSFYNKVHNNPNFLFHYAAFRIFDSPVPVARLLYINEIYFPIIFKSNKKTPFFHTDYELHLISFKTGIQSSTNGTKEIVEFNYANIDNLFRFVDELTIQEITNNFSDNYINLKGTEEIKMNKLKSKGYEVISIEIDLELAKSLFYLNKKKLQTQMKSEIK